MNQRLRLPPGLDAWIILGAMSLVMLVNTGFAYYGAGVLNPVMAQQLGIDRGMLGLGFTAMLMVQGFAGPANSALLSRIGVRWTVAAGSLLLCAGSLLMAYCVSSGWPYVLAFGVVMGLGTGFSTYIPSQTLVAQWFTRRQALAFSIVMVAAGIGGFIASPWLGALLAGNGGDWQAGWRWVAVATLSMAVVAALVIREAPPASADTGLAGEPAAAAAAVTDPGWTAAGMLKTRLLWILVLSEAALSMPLISLFAHGVVHLEQLGHSTAEASISLGMLSLSNVGGAMLAGMLADRIEPRRIWAVALLLTAASCALASYAVSLASLYMFSIALGASVGAGLICKSAVVGRYYGAAAMAKFMGTMAPFSMTLTALSPYVMGLIYERYGSYVPALLALAVLAVLASLSLLVVSTPAGPDGVGVQPQPSGGASI